MKPAVDKDKLFRILCGNDIHCTTDVSCIPSTFLANLFDTSRYQVKKTLKVLMDEGLVESSVENVYSWFAEKYHIVRGYCVTKKAQETSIYKEIETEYNEYLSRMCNGTLEEYNESIK